MESWSQSSWLLSCATHQVVVFHLSYLIYLPTLPNLHLHPFSAYEAAADDVNVRESWVLPVVLKFDGKPVVTEKGNIVYQFEVRSSVASIIQYIYIGILRSYWVRYISRHSGAAQDSREPKCDSANPN